MILVYLRTSQINGCAYCIDMHSRDLIKDGLAIEKLVLVQAWLEAGGLFDARERAALAWAETVTCRDGRAGRRLPGRFGCVFRKKNWLI